MNEYYIEVTKLFSDKCYRLQKDKITWRKINYGESYELKESDFITTDPDELIRLQKINHEIEYDGVISKVRLTSGKSSINDLSYRVKVKRSNFPEIPERDQLISVIRNGIDDRDNILILNKDGLFELRDLESMMLNIEDPNIILEFSSFCEGLDFVGEEASKDTMFIEDVYAKALECWIWYIQGNGTNIFCNMDDQSKPIEMLLKIIDEERMKYELNNVG